MRSRSDGGRLVGLRHVPPSAGTRAPLATRPNAISAAPKPAGETTSTLETLASDAPSVRADTVLTLGESSAQKTSIMAMYAGAKTVRGLFC